MKKHTIRFLSLALAALMMLTLLAACNGDAGTTPTPTPTPAQTDDNQGDVKDPEGTANLGEGITGISDDAVLRVALSAEPDNLLPLYAESKVSSSVNICLYDSLVFWNVDKAECEPRLATHWEWVDEDGSINGVRFTLREDIYTSGGYHITASDVLFSLRIALTGTNTALVPYMDLENSVVEGEYTVFIRTNKPYPTFMDRIGNDMYAIVSEEAVTAAGGVEAVLRNPKGIGTGKYVFDEWVDGQYISIVRNDDYWDQDALPYYKQIVFSFISDTASRAMSVESGDVDVAAEIQASQVKALEGNDSLNIVIENMGVNRTFYMNCSSGPLSDPLVREAIFYLLDPNAVMAIANGGYGTISETNFSQLNPYYAAPEAGFERKVDVEKAKQLLADAGYADGFELSFMTVPTSQATAEVVQENLRQGGITLNVELLEVGTYIGRLMGGQYECYIGSADNWDAAILLRALDGRLPTPVAFGGAQLGAGTDTVLEGLIDAASTEFDDATRMAAYAAVQKHVRDNHIAIGLCNEIRIECFKKELTGLSFDMRGYAIYMNMRPAA